MIIHIYNINNNIIKSFFKQKIFIRNVEDYVYNYYLIAINNIIYSTMLINIEE